MQKTLIRRRVRAFTLIELLIVIAVIAILASIAMPSLLATRRDAQEASALTALRQISSAQETYRLRHSPAVYTTLATLGSSDLMDSVLASGHKSGYQFEQPVAPTATTFVITATPDTGAGYRSFYLDQTGVIRYATGAAATAGSPPMN